ncbi:copper resistance D family protein [Niallia sp. FSL W8-0635]|uniref:copper resistance D family protein n=1 Tax=Niallia sp. FSL W8-0635 TaxID=2975337 RepID=UPI0030F6B988
MFLTTISQTILYVFYGLLLGSYIMFLVPVKYKPTIYVPRKILLFSLLGLVIFSFIPIVPLIFHLSLIRGKLEAISLILFTFEIGKSWTLTFIVSLFFAFFILYFEQSKKRYNIIGLIFTMILIGVIGWSSHASSLDPMLGFISHTGHFTAVSIWTGILLIVSWFSLNQNNWLFFLKWFTPVAITCLVITALSGIVLMNYVIDFQNYYNSWMLPYGQALLVKHLLIIPLLIYAFINGFFIKGKIKKETDFNPRPWAKIESVIIILIFSATASLSQQSPPRETVITNESLAKIFTFFYPAQVNADTAIHFSISFISSVFILLALGSLFSVLFFFHKKYHVVVSFVMSILIVVFLYFSIMLAIY